MSRSIHLLTSIQKTGRIKRTHENSNRNWEKAWISDERTSQFYNEKFAILVQK